MARSTLSPETQEAFEALCDTWWRGGEICMGVRDYAADPWQARSWGITVGSFQYRYTGGSHIEASPGERGGLASADRPGRRG